MTRPDDLEFRYAVSAEDFAQIHALNHRTFVIEIPQHHNPDRDALVDKFHSKNKYLIALRGGVVVGMISAHDQPPFSVADRLPDPGILVKQNVRPVEIRLLAIEPSERKSAALAGLLWELYLHAKAGGYTHFVISGIVAQQPLYEHLGFEPLGPPVGNPPFVPMWLPVERVEAKLARPMALWRKRKNLNAGSAS